MLCNFQVNGLKCYICDGCSKIDMKTRQHVQSCDAGEYYCKKEEAEDGLGWTKIFKECTSSCTESDSYNNRVKCCTTDVCNSSSRNYSVEILKLLTLLSIFKVIKFLAN
ncbi:unnamed protein product [Brachionus calyciflorus]|uniref:Snake toxin/toxin-like domain-containing protein n=1 Tax=Brachionus calyciflorus TaxID=104777 RepID=A0A813MQH7_9BILA|nr:unnamed protein product [Brachionus calyciflorus]